MTIRLSVVAICAAAFLPLKAAPQAAPAPSNGLEILEVRPSFFVIAGAGSNIGVQVGEDGIVVVRDVCKRAGRAGRDQKPFAETYPLHYRYWA
jgi:hypothetical protein